MDPAYVDVAVKRWQSATGQEAVLDGVGQMFDEVATERQGNGCQADGALSKALVHNYPIRKWHRGALTQATRLYGRCLGA